MLNNQYFFLIYINNKKLHYILIISLLYGWILIKLISSFYMFFILKKTYLLKHFCVTFFLNYKKIWKLFYIYTIGYQLSNKTFLILLGTGYKTSVRYSSYYMRFGFSNKTIIDVLQNIKLCLVKKIFMTVKSRNWNLTRLLAYKLKLLSRNNVYKKKGIYYKNELIFLKQGKITKN
jgi:hypothetical protein